jgi:hypothetical protein
MASDITEEFQLDLTGNAASALNSSEQTVSYDVAIAGIGFHLANSPDEPYRRQSAQYKKDQQDNSSEPGEQTFANWWLRSQSSFHLGAGIKFFEPAQEQAYAQNQTIRFRYEESEGLNVWSKGEVSLLNDTFPSDHYTIGNETECLRTIPQGVLLHDGYDLDKISSTGVVTHFVEYINTSTGLPYTGAEKVYAVCDNGTDAFWLTNAGGKWQIWKKPLSSTTPSTYTTPGDATKLDESATAATVTYGHMEWIKERIVLAINNKLYEYSGSGALAVGSPIYTFNSTGTVVTSITASGSAVYVAFQNGIDSSILQLSLDIDTLALTPVGITAELPRTEIVQAIKYYLGYVVIGTSKGVRVAQVENDGSLIYGPLLFESTNPCYQFAASDRFVWVACGVGAKAGLVRIDLSNQYDTLVFPYANDLVAKNADGTIPERATTGVAFMGTTNILAFTTPKVSSVNGDIYIQDLEALVPSGYLTTGRIRFNTIENKLYKFIIDSATYNGSSSITISYINKLGSTTSLYTLNSSNGNRENDLGISDPQEFIQLKFTLTSSGTSTPAFYGYQLKALPAAKRQRLIQYPVFNMDTETDKYNNRVGYTGKAYSAIVELEQREEDGDTVTVVDYRTGETFNAMIEEISYIGETPPDRGNENFGGKLLITVRKI